MCALLADLAEALLPVQIGPHRTAALVRPSSSFLCRGERLRAGHAFSIFVAIKPNLTEQAARIQRPRHLPPRRAPRALRRSQRRHRPGRAGQAPRGPPRLLAEPQVDDPPLLRRRPVVLYRAGGAHSAPGGRVVPRGARAAPVAAAGAPVCAAGASGARVELQCGPVTGRRDRVTDSQGVEARLAVFRTTQGQYLVTVPGEIGLHSPLRAVEVRRQHRELPRLALHEVSGECSVVQLGPLVC
mmetsp:Transcript_75428/g.201598  ORF Transcript_75428/g.201598 Transcript_75428/m.201598 type:complete len:242 (-) Transcript_75428:2165-2890(-)